MKLLDILTAFQWRYAVKIFDTKKKLHKADIETLLEIIRLSPSSLGLQPYKIVIVENKKLRQQIFNIASHQRKIIEAPYLLVFCTYKKYSRTFVDSFINRFVKERKLTLQQAKNLRTARQEYISKTSFRELDEWAGNQAFIALGVLLSAAAIAHIDAGPMGGFEPKKLDKILNLKKYNLHSRVLCALGHRSFKDPEAKAIKVRRPLSELVIKLK